MLHVAVLFEFPTLYGGEQSMLAVLRLLHTSTQMRFTAIAPPSGHLSDRLQFLGVPTVPFTVRSPSGTRRADSDLVSDLQSVVALLRPNILHANSLSMSRLIGRTGSQLCTNCCTGHVRDIIKLSNQAVMDVNRLDRVAAVSHATKDFHKAQGVQPELVQVIYNGVDTDQFRPRSQTAARNALLPQLPASARVLLNVGQICLRKGQLDLARAVVQLLNNRNDLHLVLIGERHSEKAESIAFEKLVVDEFSKHGMLSHLHRRGFCHNVDQWMNAADLLVHSARQEPLGRVLLESAACGLPIVATDVGGTSEIVQHEQTGLLIPGGSIDALRNGLAGALCNPSHCESLAAAATDRIRREFTAEQAAASLRAFWHETIDRIT